MDRRKPVTGLSAASVLALMQLLTACGAPPAVEHAARGAGIGAVRAALDTSVLMWNRGDLDAHVAVYADSALLLPGVEARGRVQARRTLASYFADPIARPRLALDSLRLAPLGSGYVLATGQYVLEGGTVSGPRRGWFTEVWGRTPDGWRIIHDHSS